MSFQYTIIDWEIFEPSKLVKSFKSDISDTIYNGNYYALGKLPNGEILISENKSVETMGFAQNWSAKEENVIYEQRSKI